LLAVRNFAIGFVLLFSTGWAKSKASKRLILLPLPRPRFIFRVFSPKIARQVPKASKSDKQNKIELAF
jgi:hypothetical protein